MKTNRFMDMIISVTKKIDEESKGARILLEQVKADTEYLDGKDKATILDRITNYNWDVDDAVSSVFREKLERRTKIALVKEIFPDFASASNPSTDTN